MAKNRNKTRKKSRVTRKNPDISNFIAREFERRKTEKKEIKISKPKTFKVDSDHSESFFRKRLKIGDFLTKLFVIIVLIALVLSVLLPILFSLPASAQISISKANTVESGKLDSSHFLVQLKPGESYQNAIKLQNSSSEDELADVKSNDTTFLPDGSLTAISNNLENKEVGKWIQLKEGRYTVPKLGNSNVPFKIQVPENISDGEYVGGITATTVKNAESGSVEFGRRVGVRTYILIGDQFKLSPEFKNLRILNSKILDSFDNPEFDAGNINFAFDAQNKGNIFGLIKGTYTLTFEDKKVRTGEFVRSIPPTTETYKINVSTQIPYQTGKTKLDINYSFLPENPLLKGKEIEGSLNNQILSTDLSLNYEELNKIPNKNLVKSTTFQTKEIIPRQLIWILVVSGVALTGVFGFATFLLLRKRKISS